LQFDAVLEADTTAFAAADANAAASRAGPIATDFDGANERVLLPAFAATGGEGTGVAAAAAAAAAAASSEPFRVPSADPSAERRAKAAASQARARELVRRRNKRTLGDSGTGTAAAAAAATGLRPAAAKAQREPAWRSPARAAACVQAAWRGWRQRRGAQRQRAAAVCLQRVWRGWAQRRAAAAHGRLASRARELAAAGAARGFRRQTLEAELQRLKGTSVTKQEIFKIDKMSSHK
jgi:hypothetical protein